MSQLAKRPFQNGKRCKSALKNKRKGYGWKRPFYLGWGEVTPRVMTWKSGASAPRNAGTSGTGFSPGESFSDRNRKRPPALKGNSIWRPGAALKGPLFHVISAALSCEEAVGAGGRAAR